MSGDHARESSGKRPSRFEPLEDTRLQQPDKCALPLLLRTRNLVRRRPVAGHGQASDRVGDRCHKARVGRVDVVPQGAREAHGCAVQDGVSDWEEDIGVEIGQVPLIRPARRNTSRIEGIPRAASARS